MSDLFNNNGAEFSSCGKYRYVLWRIWDDSKPKVMFIGLNPSTANQTTNDPTIRRVCQIARHNGFGGVYMCNCFAFVSPDPRMLIVEDPGLENYKTLISVAKGCAGVVFAWGNFKAVTENKMDVMLMNMFPNAKALAINKNGSPKHPLYCRVNTQFIKFNITK